MRRILILIALSLPLASPAAAQEKFRAAFYNLENFFDNRPDSLTADDDFTPMGNYHWTRKRFEQKKLNMAKAIAALGGEDGLVLLGLCELENAYVLRSLFYFSPLKRAGFRFVHYDSPDVRGIDAALAYDPERFEPLHSEPVRVRLSDDGSQTTRDILYVRGLALGFDTLHVFVCHAPSRRGGEAASRYRRAIFARTLRGRCDSIFARCDSAKVLIMGDFNDFPSDESMSVVLGASLDDVAGHKLYNLMAPLERAGEGSYKFRGDWNMLDQMIISASLKEGPGLRAGKEGAAIFRAAFLTEADEKNFGVKPFRTFLGPRYLGGFSDHLPVYCDFVR